MALHYSPTALSPPDQLDKHRYTDSTPFPLKYLVHLFPVPVFRVLIFCHYLYFLSTHEILQEVTNYISVPLCISDVMKVLNNFKYFLVKSAEVRIFLYSNLIAHWESHLAVNPIVLPNRYTFACQ